MGVELHKSNISVLIISRGKEFKNHLQACINQFKDYKNVFVITIDNDLKFLKNCRLLSVSAPEDISDIDLEKMILTHFFTVFPFPSKLLVLHEYELLDTDAFEAWISKGANFEKCMSARFATRRPFYKLEYVTNDLYPSVIYLNFEALGVTRQTVIKLLDENVDRIKLFAKLKNDGSGNFEGVVVNGQPIVYDTQFVGSYETLFKRCKILGESFNQEFTYDLQFLIPGGNFVGVDIFRNSSYLVLSPPSFLKNLNLSD